RPQCGPCHFEVRGGVEAYCETAVRRLAAGGAFVVCAAAVPGRGVGAAPPRGRPPHAAPGRGGPPGRAPGGLSLWGTPPPRRGGDAVDEAIPVPAPAELVVRDVRGQWTAGFSSLRAAMGLPTRPH